LFKLFHLAKLRKVERTRRFKISRCLAYCSVILCHKSDEQSTATVYPRAQKTLELNEKHDKHVIQLTAGCN